MEARGLRSKLSERRAGLANGSILDCVRDMPKKAFGAGLKCRRTLTGHYGKVYALHWSGDDSALLSASQDGKLIVWNTVTAFKKARVVLKSSWVMTCAFERSAGRVVASGGLDNTCSIYAVDEAPRTGTGDTASASVAPAAAGADDAARTTNKPVKELVGHDGYLSCVRFMDEHAVITSSGDNSLIYWDLESAEALRHFHDHKGDVMSLSIRPNDTNVLVSGACDSKVIVWDARIAKSVCSLHAHESDVNGVDYLEDGYTFATASDDASCKVFDTRCLARELHCFKNEATLSGVTSVAFSKSGRLILAGYDNNSSYAWDLLSDGSDSAFAMTKHTDRVSCVGVNASGRAFATGSWDSSLMVRTRKLSVLARAPLRAARRCGRSQVSRQLRVPSVVRHLNIYCGHKPVLSQVYFVFVFVFYGGRLQRHCLPARRTVLTAKPLLLQEHGHAVSAVPASPHAAEAVRTGKTVPTVAHSCRVVCATERYNSSPPKQTRQPLYSPQTPRAEQTSAPIVPATASTTISGPRTDDTADIIGRLPSSVSNLTSVPVLPDPHRAPLEGDSVTLVTVAKPSRAAFTAVSGASHCSAEVVASRNEIVTVPVVAVH